MFRFVRVMICIAICAVIFLSAAYTDVSAEEVSVSAKAAVLIDAQTGRVIYGKNENTRLPMASTTKIMTTLLTLESGDLDSEFTVDSSAVKTEGSSMGLCEGDIVSKRDLCIGMLLPSGNDAANCAAVCVGGSMERFAELMNKRAEELGMSSTHFVTPSGLHDDAHYSTAKDMAILTAAALKNPDFAAICGQSSIQLDFGNPPYTRWLKNTNKLLGMYDGCIGVKTGFTDEAGRCLVSAVERDGTTLICVTLNAPDDWNDHIKLYDYGFSQVSKIPVELDGTVFVNVVGSSADSVRLELTSQALCTQIEGQTPDITWKAVVPQMVYAPVEKGQIIGTAMIYDKGTLVCEIPLAASDECTAEIHSTQQSLYDSIVQFFKMLLFS